VLYGPGRSSGRAERGTFVETCKETGGSTSKKQSGAHNRNTTRKLANREGIWGGLPEGKTRRDHHWGGRRSSPFTPRRKLPGEGTLFWKRKDYMNPGNAFTGKKTLWGGKKLLRKIRIEKVFRWRGLSSGAQSGKIKKTRVVIA